MPGPAVAAPYAKISIIILYSIKHHVGKRSRGTEPHDGLRSQYGRSDGFGRQAPELPEGAATVGAEMNVSHIKPSGLGAEIVASAVVTAVEGRKITFNVGARDADGMIGEGTHVRFIVDRERFLAKLK